MEQSLEPSSDTKEVRSLVKEKTRLWNTKEGKANQDDLTTIYRESIQEGGGSGEKKITGREGGKLLRSSRRTHQMKGRIKAQDIGGQHYPLIEG